MDVTSFLLAEWVLWVRGAVLAALGYFLCRRRNYAAVAVALLAAYWAYSSLSFVVEFRSEVVRQVGTGYILQACLALVLPFAAMGLGLRGRKGNADASPNGGPAMRSDHSPAGGGPPSVS